jgi:hypothetical protein
MEMSDYEMLRFLIRLMGISNYVPENLGARAAS